MAKTFLDAVNDVLKETRVIEGETDELTTFVSAPIQQQIDRAKRAWNTTVQHLYTFFDAPVPKRSGIRSVTLVSGQREYSLPSDLLQIRWPLINETDGKVITEYEGGFEKMRTDQLQPGNWTGEPSSATINPENDKLRLNAEPTASEAGDQYKLLYEKSVTLVIAEDRFPFHDDVVDALVPAVVEVFERKEKFRFDGPIFLSSLSRALDLINRQVASDTW